MSPLYRDVMRAGAVLTALFAARSLDAQPRPLRLAEAIARATRVSPALREGRAQRDVAAAQRRGAAARLYPEFSTNIIVQRNPQLNATILPAEVFGGSGDPRVVRLGTPYESGVTRTLRVPLFDAAQRASVAEGASAITRATVALEQIQEALALSVTSAYVALHARRAEHDAARALAEARGLQRLAAEQNLTAGRATTQQVDLLRVAEDEARIAERRARIRAEAAEETLALLISDEGRAQPNDRLVLEDSLVALLTPRRNDSTWRDTPPAELLAASSVRLARADEAAAAAARQREKRVDWPTLRLVGTLSTVAFANGLQDVTLSGRRFTRSSLALQFEPPTLDFGIRRAQRAEADARARAATSRRETVERDVALAERDAWRARALAFAEVDVAASTRRVRLRALALAEADASSGRGTPEAVALARADAEAARASETLAMANAIVQDTEWRRSAGRPLSPEVATAPTTGPNR